MKLRVVLQVGGARAGLEEAGRREAEMEEAVRQWSMCEEQERPLNLICKANQIKSFLIVKSTTHHVLY